MLADLTNVRSYYLSLGKLFPDWAAAERFTYAKDVINGTGSFASYGTPDEPGAFDDDPLKQSEHGYTLLCPQCKGHGGWILRRDAYGAGQHFKASCNQCSGWGYVREGDAAHVHQWQHVQNTGNCLNLYRCTVPGCDREQEVDSSD